MAGVALDQFLSLVQPFYYFIVDLYILKSVLIISFSNIHSDPRVMRQVRLLENNFKVTVAGFGVAPQADVDFIRLDNPLAGLARKGVWAVKLLLGMFEYYYWRLPEVISALRLVARNEFNLVIANDVSALPLAIRLAGSTPVIVDAHEYSPKEFEDRFLWRFFYSRYYDYLCRSYLSRASSMITVCQGISDAYEQEYGVTSHVVYNAPLDQKLSPSSVRAECIRLIHHGSAIRSRHLGVMIDMMKHLDDRFSLDFMLVETDSVYMAELRAKAAVDARIRFVEPVPMPEICRRLNEYDIGVYLLPPVNFNQKHALPNKFFEFIQARLAVAIGPSPEMAILLRGYECGVIADSFQPQALAAVLQELDAQRVAKLKEASDRAARDLNYERGGELLVSEIDRVINL